MTSAKLIIKLIHAVGDIVNRDARVRGLLKVVFLAELSGVARREYHSRCRFVRTDFDRGMEASGPAI